MKTKYDTYFTECTTTNYFDRFKRIACEQQQQQQQQLNNHPTRPCIKHGLPVNLTRRDRIYSVSFCANYIAYPRSINTHANKTDNWLSNSQNRTFISANRMTINCIPVAFSYPFVQHSSLHCIINNNEQWMLKLFCFFLCKTKNPKSKQKKQKLIFKFNFNI